jgi:hypothetical protein
MNSLKINNKVRNNIITKTTSLALASILITSMFVGLIPIVVMPAAAANTYLSVSSTKLGLADGAGNAIKIQIDDSSLTDRPSILVETNGANSTTVLTQDIVKSNVGPWFIYIAHNESTASITNPASNNGSTVLRLLNLTSDVAGTTNATSLTITYVDRGESEVITIGETAVSSATTDRSEAPPDGKVHITFSDATSNLDPTSKDSKNYTMAVTVNLVARALPVNITMTETGVDTGLFIGTLNMTGITASVPVHGDLLSATITDDDDSDDTVLVTVDVRASDGVLSTVGTLTYSTSVNVTLTDADRNLDTLVAETLVNTTNSNVVVQVNATVGTSLYNMSDLHLKETGKNTGIFIGTISAAIGNVTALAAATNGTIAVNYNVSAGASLSIALRYDDPTQIISNHYSEASISLDNTPATIAFDQSSYLPNANGVPAVITLTESDANDNALAIELLTITDASTIGINLHSGGTLIGMLNFTETKGTTTNKINVTSDDIRFIETELNSGEFELRIDLETGMNGTRTSAWTIKASYYDSFNAITTTGTASIGGSLASIALDRTVLPVHSLAAKVATVRITLNDTDANTNAAAIDSTTVSLLAKNATNIGVNFNGSTTSLSITVTETGQDTSIFKGSFTYNITSADGNVTVAPGDDRTWHLVDDTGGAATERGVTGSLMIGGTFNVTYTEPLATGNHIDAIGTITPHTGILSVTPSGVNLNGSVVFTYTDEDINVNTLAYDTVEINIRNTTADQTTGTLELNETGKDTGIFSATKRAGDQSPIESPSFRAGDLIKASYTDLVTSGSYYATGFATVALTGQSTVVSNNAAITLDATSYGPYSTVEVNVTDADLILSGVADEAVELALVLTSVDECRTADVGTPTKSDDTFTWTIVLSPTVTANTCQGDLKTALVDTLTVFYVDVKDAAGTAAVVLQQTVAIESVTGTVGTTPNDVLVGEFLTITVTDLDQNRDGNVFNSVTVIVSTNTWAVGRNVTLPETLANSAIFEAKVKIVPGMPINNNEVRGTVGDTITVSYKDRSNATGKVSNVVVTANVGITVPVLERVPAGAPSTVDLDGNAVAPTVDVAVAVQSQICNDDIVVHAFTYIIVVKDAGGVVTDLAWSSGSLPAVDDSTSTCLPYSASWTPDSAGEYTITTYVLDSILSGIALSPKTTLTVTVVA